MPSPANHPQPRTHLAPFDDPALALPLHWCVQHNALLINGRLAAEESRPRHLCSPGSGGRQARQTGSRERDRRAACERASKQAGSTAGGGTGAGAVGQARPGAPSRLLTWRRLQLVHLQPAAGAPQLAGPRLIAAEQHAVAVGGAEVDVADCLGRGLPPAASRAGGGAGRGDRANGRPAVGGAEVEIMLGRVHARRAESSEGATLPSHQTSAPDAAAHLRPVPDLDAAVLPAQRQLAAVAAEGHALDRPDALGLLLEVACSRGVSRKQREGEEESGN